jgi:hypothetical protein
MNCIQFSITSMLPSWLGIPDDNDFINCSIYGSINSEGATLCNCIDGTSINPPPVSPGADGYWEYHANTVIGGSALNHATLVNMYPWTDDEKAQQCLFGLSFLPWNQSQYKRVLNLTTDTIPLNPWNKATMIVNGKTIVKLSVVGIGVYFAIAYAMKSK